MKIYRYIWTMGFIACFCMRVNLSWAEDVQRVFMGADGRSISGTLIGYNPYEQIATIKRSDDEKFRVSLDVFSEADQQYIQKQGRVIDFMQSIKIIPILREFDATGRYDETRYKAAHVKSLGYAVSLANCSFTIFEEIEIEYCLFYRQRERRREHRMEFLHGVQYGRWELGPMIPGSRHVVETERVLIHDEKSKCTVFGDDGRAKGGVEGIWLRLVSTRPSEAGLFREFLSPGHIDNYRNWTPITVPVGLNKYSRK